MGDSGTRPDAGSSPGGERRAPGALEAEILAILRDAGRPLSPGEVRQRLASSSAVDAPGREEPPGPPELAEKQSSQQRPGERPGELSYSTVVTIVSRLHAKGLLARQRAGRGYAYTPVDEASVAARLMGQVLGREHDHDAVLTRFVSGLSRRDARLLRGLLDSDPGPGGRGRAGEQG